jgi:sacsin
MTIQMFRNCLDEARLTLLFLRNISCIDFSMRHDEIFDWRVRRGKWPESGTFSDWANVVVERCNSQDDAWSTTERWWRVIVDVPDAPAELQSRHKRRMKYVECGIAALVPADQEVTGLSLNRLKSKFFNCVPLKFESTLPVQVHATFLLSGDRQNIATEETSQDAGSDWNKWLLKERIPQVYLQFLEDVGRKVGPDVYDYFPSEPNQTQQNLSDLVRTAFWEKLKSSHHRLFPVVEAVQVEDTRGKSAMRPKRRQAPKLVEPRHAVFDFLDKKRSHAFEPLLSNCLENLVCPPMRICAHVRSVPQFDSVTPSLIRRILQSDKAVKYVERMVRMDNDYLPILLSYIVPGTDGDLVELDGCAILPLMNGSLGTLSLRAQNKATNNPTFFSASAECHRLFSFASSHFSQDKGNERFVEKILDSGRLNLERFQKRHVAVMLQCKRSWTVDATSKKWLFDFWAHLNSTSQFAERSVNPNPLDLESLQHFPLLLCRRGGTEKLRSLYDFQNNPAVLSSDVKRHEELYADFTELDVVDSRTIPMSYREAEKSLFDSTSMNRLLKSVEILARKNAQNVTEFVGSRLKERNIKVGQSWFLILCNCANLCVKDFARHSRRFQAWSCSPAVQHRKRPPCVAANFVWRWVSDRQRGSRSPRFSICGSMDERLSSIHRRQCVPPNRNSRQRPTTRTLRPPKPTKAGR